MRRLASAVCAYVVRRYIMLYAICIWHMAKYDQGRQLPIYLVLVAMVMVASGMVWYYFPSDLACWLAAQQRPLVVKSFYTTLTQHCL